MMYGRLQYIAPGCIWAKPFGGRGGGESGKQVSPASLRVREINWSLDNQSC